MAMGGSISTLRKRLEIQGFRGFTDTELSCHQFGIRFAYGVCAVLVVLSLLYKSIPILLFVLGIAILGIFLKRHPADYLYNAIIRHWLKRPILPYRTRQVRFACLVATFWLLVTIYLFANNFVFEARIWGSILVAVATLVTTTDICIPSMIYNFLFERKK